MVRRILLAAARHCRTALRSLSPASVVAVTLALVLGGATIAAAANGGTFLLGKANSETATASLTNTTGTPLKLSAPAGKAPLAVTQNVMVNNLNAQFTGGLPASQLQVTGGDGIVPIDSGVSMSQGFSEITSTGALPAGTYYVNTSAAIFVEPGDGGAVCFIGRASAQQSAIQDAGNDIEGNVDLAVAAVASITAGDSFQLWCAVRGNNGSFLDNAVITAIRVLSSHGSPPARTGRPIGALLPGAARSAPAHRPGARQSPGS